MIQVLGKYTVLGNVGIKTTIIPGLYVFRVSQFFFPPRISAPQILYYPSPRFMVRVLFQGPKP